MTGKEFFGKLLSNRQERRSSWNEEEPEQGAPDADVDVMPSGSGGPHEDHSRVDRSHDEAPGREDAFPHDAPSSRDVPASHDSRDHSSNARADAAGGSYFDAPISNLESHSAERDDRDSSGPTGVRNGDFAESRYADGRGPSDTEPSRTRSLDSGFDEANERSGRSVRDERPHADPQSFTASGGDGLSVDLPDVQPAPMRRDSDPHRVQGSERTDSGTPGSDRPHSAPSQHAPAAGNAERPVSDRRDASHARYQESNSPGPAASGHVAQQNMDQGLHGAGNAEREIRAQHGRGAADHPQPPQVRQDAPQQDQEDYSGPADRRSDDAAPVRPAENRQDEFVHGHHAGDPQDGMRRVPQGDARQDTPQHAQSAEFRARTPEQPESRGADPAPSQAAEPAPPHTAQPVPPQQPTEPAPPQQSAEPAPPQVRPEDAASSPQDQHARAADGVPNHGPSPAADAASENGQGHEGAPAEHHVEAAPSTERGPEPADRAPEHVTPEPAPQSDGPPETPSDDDVAAEPEDPSAGPEKPAAKQSSKNDADLRNIKDRVVIRLLDKKVVTVEQVKAALTNRDKKNLKATLWRILAQQTGTDREQIYREAALTYAFTERKIDDAKIDLDFIRQVADVFPEKKRNRLIELRIVPIGYEFEQQTQMLRVVFITHDPSLPAVRELMQDLNLERYELQYASETTVKDLLSRAFPKKNEYLERMTDDPLAYDLGTSYDEGKSELIDEDALEAEINRSSLINLFEGALVEAVHRGASDIHIYPNAHRQIEFHFRVDGRLAHWHTEDKVHPESLLAVIKDNTMNVDRFERDSAQDGFIQRKVDDALIRYRVSILPIATASNGIHAESIVIRVLDDRKVITDLSQLGLLEGALERFDMAIRQPHGMVILTGPTGSGKSTTLVAALHQVVTPQVNVLTVEDPVEYIISGVRQIKLNHKLGLEGALRAILRHDPDVVMVGEMRDKETADLAVKLANTGHLTFSTLHTNDAPSAVSRLYKMGVEPFLIAYAINLVVAQRLLRNICPDCKVVDNDPDPVLLKKLGFTEQDIHEHTIYKSSGDPTCKTCKGVGFKGRRAISEALYFSREIRHMIVEADKKIDEDALREMARKQGMLTLQDSAREVVKMGETSVDEMMRVTMTED